MKIHTFLSLLKIALQKLVCNKNDEVFEKLPSRKDSEKASLNDIPTKNEPTWNQQMSLEEESRADKARVW